MILGNGLVAALLAGTVGIVPVYGPQADTVQPTLGKAGGVTLITGDRVVVTGKSYRVEPGPGRQVAFMRQIRGDHLYVIPSDAQPLVTQGILDRRLFDVTQLLEWRYGDADRGDIPLITQSGTGPAPALRGAQGARQLAGLGMTTLRLPKSGAAQTWKEMAGGARTLAAGATKIWLDGRLSYSLDQSVKQIGASEAWKQGMTGEGVTVAVLDSGYDPDHPDLKGVVAQERNFSDDPDIRDPIGHGTHVASIVASNGEKYRGVAPGARLAIGKVGGSFGASESAIIAGMEWAAVEVKAKVVNFSMGSPDGPEIDPVEQAVNTLSERTGTLFVVASGNTFRDPVMSPGSADAALTVGAVDRQDRMAPFSSTGPRLGDHAVKPDLTAPGVGIVAAAAAGTAEGTHVAMNGTSMAAPHVAGAAAILAQRHPDWTGRQLKAALAGSAAPSPGATPYQQGTGRVDVVRALKQQVVAQTADTWAAFPWDGPDERTKTGTITYTNSGDTPANLDLTADGDVLKLSTQRIEVPAGGQASVTLTIDAAGKAPGDYVGTITATSGDTVIRTLAGAYVEPESYNATITVIGRQGEPVDPMSAQVYDPKTGAIIEPVFENGVATVRLAKGDWNLYTEIADRIDGRSNYTVADSPLRVDGNDLQLTVDARRGKATKVTLDDPSAELTDGFDFGLAHGAWNSSGTWYGTDITTRFFVVPVQQPGLTYTFRTLWLSKDVSPSPYVYDLVDRRTGGIPDNPTYTARQKDLAKVSTTYRASGVAATGTQMAGPRDEGHPGMYLTALVGDIPLPGTLIQYRTPGVTYESGLQVGTALTFDGGTLMKRGQTSEVWNAAVTGPSFLLPGGSRTGDTLTFSAVGLFADAGAGRTGSDTAATGTATLAKDGKVLATTDIADCEVYQKEECELHADLPAQSGAYTLTASTRRQVPHSTLSTGVESVWTFRSATTAKEQPLPLMAVRYSPAGLDDSNRAKPASITRLPLWIERNPGAPKSAVKSIRLEMSSDDGASWRRIPVVPTPSGWTAMVPNPRTPGFVSLRAVATDTSGAGLTQTITRAYAVG
ncbi:S8 family serine peptidase [Microtetraspora fusca]|uniref:S8 family serine peptidase n=1 Tax=Microtetraspora fusca TaxID=1997 RepID=UPI00082C8A6A|nr:S8 family serine peptidase [Microtetraspora fusca]